MKVVLDATAFFVDRPYEGEVYTSPRVVAELVDLRAKCRYEALLAAGLTVTEPSPEAWKAAEAAAGLSRDIGVLSPTDLEVLALARDLEGVLYTDDFAVQNAAITLGVKTRPIQQRRAKKVKWKYRCAGCGRYYDEPGECPVCGAEVRRKRR
ncbi:nucleotide-binding protein [Methanofollis formosanus]|uniref:Nucleotide-binding protein n=1 Tax=Methanofollis formosanus TaxID=299308 RepID=A0A8G1A1Z7_9EURY|nr:nucleotide-binding protein [Methanofollis formosanus]QYZ79595.1 nucleotide-binding protein [Methanofollis formosanus]